MSSFRFVHAADVHLDSPLRGLEAYSGAPVKRLRMATRRALENVVKLCVDEQVDFLVIAGDLFDTDCKDFQSALSAANQLQQLKRAGIPVYLILGNHDSFFERTRQVPWPSNVTVFDHKKPQTVLHPTLQLALHGMSYPQRELTRNLVPEYPKRIGDLFNLGLLHTNAGGNLNHDSYAPCTIEELVAKGYDYWALGHVHDFQVLHADPPIIYSGNTQGRHAREVGRKGCVLVQVDDGKVASHELRETDVMRWFQCEVILEPDDGEEELIERTHSCLTELVQQADGRLAAVRLAYRGRTRVHQLLSRDSSREQIVTNVRAQACEFGDDVWVEKIRFDTRSPLDVSALRQGQDLVGQLLRELDAIASNPEQLQSLAEPLRPLFSKVSIELAAEATRLEQQELDNPARMRQWLQATEELLLSYLIEERS